VWQKVTKFIQAMVDKSFQICVSFYLPEVLWTTYSLSFYLVIPHLKPSHFIIQVFSFHTQEHLTPEDIAAAVEAQSPEPGRELAPTPRSLRINYPATFLMWNLLFTLPHVESSIHTFLCSFL
jgi:hypothetical protein